VNLDSLLRIGIDAAAAFAAMNLVNAMRKGWLWPNIKTWLNTPSKKREKTARVIQLAWWVSLVTSGVFALRVYTGGWQAFMGEWLSRAIIIWLLSMGQFDVIKITWPAAFGQEEVSYDQSVD
jgi:hypothetical protein